MPDELEAEVTFTPGGLRMEALSGIAVLVLGLAMLPSSQYFSVLMGVFGGYFIWRSVRSWRKPYVVLDPERLVVFDHGRPVHYVPFAAIAAVETGFNSTRLRMRDGLKISVSNDGFVSRTDIERFRCELGKRVNLEAAQPTVPSA